MNGSWGFTAFFLVLFSLILGGALGEKTGGDRVYQNCAAVGFSRVNGHYIRCAPYTGKP